MRPDEFIQQSKKLQEPPECRCTYSGRRGCSSRSPEPHRWCCSLQVKHDGNHIACTPQEHRFAEWSRMEFWEYGSKFSVPIENQDVVHDGEKDEDVIKAGIEELRRSKA